MRSLTEKFSKKASGIAVAAATAAMLSTNGATADPIQVDNDRLAECTLIYADTVLPLMRLTYDAAVAYPDVGVLNARSISGVRTNTDYITSEEETRAALGIIFSEHNQMLERIEEETGCPTGRFAIPMSTP